LVEGASSLQLIVKTPSGKRVSIDAKSDDLVRSIKAKSWSRKNVFSFFFLNIYI
jgi:hypothetical protein